MRLGWEALLARQPGFDSAAGRAALRALIELRLVGRVASTKVAAARKRIFETGESGFVMRKVSLVLFVPSVLTGHSGHKTMNANASEVLRKRL